MHTNLIVIKAENLFCPDFSYISYPNKIFCGHQREEILHIPTYFDFNDTSESVRIFFAAREKNHYEDIVVVILFQGPSARKNTFAILYMNQVEYFCSHAICILFIIQELYC